MRGTVAKRIRAEHQSLGKHTKNHSYQVGSNGMILADRDRREYQLRKQKYKEGV